MKLFPGTSRSTFADEMHPHVVRITRPFYLAAHQVTVGQFRRFVTDAKYRTEAERDGKGGYGWNEAKGEWKQDPQYTWLNPGLRKGTPIRWSTSWNDATAFHEWLTKTDKDGFRYRLPTEAEWEYACRAGAAGATLFPNGDDPEGLAAIANVADASFKRKNPKVNWTTIKADDGHAYTAPVGSYPANPWGLHDLIGNVWEWCEDGYDADYYKTSPQDDPPGCTPGPFPCLSGWGLDRHPWDCRPASGAGPCRRTGTTSWGCAWPQSGRARRSPGAEAERDGAERGASAPRPAVPERKGRSRPVFVGQTYVFMFI